MPAGAAAAADPCGSLNFFPTASQITGLTGAAASVAVSTGVTCTGTQVCNWPAVLNRTAQESYQTELGTSVAVGGLLSVAVKEYSGKQLRVFFRPVSPLLTQNANAMSCVLAKTPAATRKLTQAATYSVANPGTWSYSATLSLGGTIPGGSRAATATGDLTFSTEGAQDVSVFCCLAMACFCYSQVASTAGLVWVPLLEAPKAFAVMLSCCCCPVPAEPKILRHHQRRADRVHCQQRACGLPSSNHPALQCVLVQAQRPGHCQVQLWLLRCWWR